MKRRGGDGAPRALRVNAGVLAGAGQELLGAANAIPAAPTPVVPVGEDPLSAAIGAQVSKVVAPVVTARPAVNQEATGYAQALVTAAQTYEGTDKRLGDNVLGSRRGLTWRSPRRSPAAASEPLRCRRWRLTVPVARMAMK